MKSLLIVLFITISPVIIAQQIVSGCITDAEDGMPVVGASVFIANTTIGTASDLDGNYSFIVPGRGSFEIVVSHIGYESVSQKIDTPQDTHRYDVALKIAELEEVTVKAAKTYKTADVNLFWQKILGEKPSRRGLEVLNPEKIYFYKSNNVLRAFCREPIEITNHQMGYRIRYILQRFEHDYRTGVTEFEGLPSFEELIPRNSREEQQWKKKRREVYAVSMNRFLRSLYRKEIHTEGFFLTNNNFPINGKNEPVNIEDILQTDQGVVRINIEASLLLLCYAVPVTDILIQNSFREIINNNAFSTIAVELLPSQFTIYPDGTYSGLLTLREVNKYMGGLSSRVPVEYAETLQNGSYGFAGVSNESISNMGGSFTPLRVSDIDRAEENILTQIEAYPQEKIHLHTDRDLYVPGEKIWFKAYVADAAAHRNSTQSRYVYVELISPADTLVNRVMVRPEEDMFHGYMPITESIPEGNYTLRAYTRYMENLGDDYFFKKNIRIKAPPQPSPAGGALSTPNNPVNPKNLSSDFDVTFYPEGGNLPEGVLCKVAFKALNRNGYPESIVGYLIDETGTEISPVQTIHAGMGVFTYLPEKGKRYRLKCVNENGLEKQFELPQSNVSAYSLAVSILTDRIMIGIRESTFAPNMPFYLLVHCRGTVIYFSDLDDSQKVVSLPVEDLPAGVIQCVLFDSQMNPLSERLVFSQNDATVPIDFHTDKEVYQIRDKIVATLSFPPFGEALSPFGGGVGGGLNHFSIAVTDDKDVAVDEYATISASLLLSSELRGYIENPAYYLQDPVAMDLLMMTHGWRRYNIPEVVNGRFENPKLPFQQYQAISGRVTGALNRPATGNEILMKVELNVGLTSTDESGRFTFRDFEYPDSTDYFIQAISRSGNSNVTLALNNELFPLLTFAPQSPPSRQKTINIEIKDEAEDNAFLVKAEQRSRYDEDMRTVNLTEVVVTAPVIQKERRLEYWMNLSSQYTLTKETIDIYKFTFLKDYLQLIPGLRVKEVDRVLYVTITGMPSDSAMLYVDGVEYTPELFSTLPVEMIESIDVIKGVNASIFGVHGAGGAISITTGTPQDIPKNYTNIAVVTPLGYQKPIEFYAPKYETLEARQSPIPDYRTTVFWKPDVVISDEHEESVFEFYTSDFPTTYSVVIEGLTADGKIVRQVEKIQVSY